jgi:hypothetical protein
MSLAEIEGVATVFLPPPRNPKFLGNRAGSTPLVMACGAIWAEDAAVGHDGSPAQAHGFISKNAVSGVLNVYEKCRSVTGITCPV